MATSRMESQLVVSLLDRLTAPARGVAATLDRLQGAATRNAARINAMRGQMLDAAGAGYALWKGLSAPVNAAVEFESAMSDIRKVVDFDTGASFRQMGLDIRKMSLEIPMAASGIAEIVAAAGQSGIAQGELSKFAEIAAKVGVAWDIGAKETGEALAKLKTALGRSLDDTASLADAINHLGNNSAASAPQILDVVRRVAPMASQFGMTAEQVAAIGAAMTGAGFEAEVASTSLLNVGRALTKGASATGRQNAVFKKLGLSAKNVAQSMQKDAVGTLQDVLSRINKLPAAVRASAISDLFGDEARALGPLISNGSLLADTLGLISDKSKYAGSASQEFKTASERTANSLQLFKNRVNDLAISVGDALLPAINSTLGRIGPMVTSISELAQQYPQVTSAIIATTAAVIGFRVAATAAGWALLFLKGGLIQAGVVGLSAVSGIGAAAMAIGRLAAAATLGTVVAAFNSLRTAMIGFAAAASIVGTGGALKIMAGSLLALLNPMALVRGAIVALKLALISSGVGVVLVGIGLAGAWIYNNWNGISRMFTAFGSAFMQAIEPVRPMLDPVINGVSDLLNWVSNLVGPVDGLGQSWFAMGRAAGTAVGELVVLMVAEFDRMIAWVKDIPSRIVAAIGRIDLSGMIRWPSLPSWMGGGEPEVTGSGIDGARAKGGPVRAGGTYLVGERGPELFSPGRSGVISPNAAYDAVSRGSASSNGSGRSASGNTFNISMNPVFNISQASDASRLADEVIGGLGNMLKSSIEAQFSD